MPEARQIVVCEPSPDGLTAAPCAPGEAPAPRELLILSPADATFLQASGTCQQTGECSEVPWMPKSVGGVDYTEAAQFFGFALIPTLAVYLGGLAVGSLLKVVGDA